MRTEVRALVVAFAFLVGMLDVAMPHVRNGNMPGDAGDSRFNLYVLEHDYRALSGADASLVNADFFYPWPTTIGFSDTHLGTLPAYALPRLAGLDQNRAFAVWFLTAFILDFWAMWLVSRAFGLDVVGSTVAAYLFTFGLPVVAQAGHEQLLYRCWVPVAMLCLDRGIARRSSLLLATAFAAWSCELAASIYDGMFLLLLMVAFVVVRQLIGRGTQSSTNDEAASGRSGTARLRRAVPPVLVAAAGLIVLVLALAPYVRVEWTYHFTRSWREIASMLPRWYSYFYDRGISRWWFGQWHAFAGLPMRHEHAMFIGIGALLALGTLVFTRSPSPDLLTRRMAGTLALLIMITLMIGPATLYRLIAFLPGFNAVRAVTRIIMVMLFPIGLLTGIAIDRIDAAIPSRRIGVVAGVVLTLLVVYDSVFSEKTISRKADWAARDAATEAAVGIPPAPGSILVIAVGDSTAGDAPVRRQIDAMRYAQRHGLRTLNGYSGNVPPGWALPRTCDDLRRTIAAANHFIRDHQMDTTPLSLDRMVLVGFGDCRA